MAKIIGKEHILVQGRHYTNSKSLEFLIPIKKFCAVQSDANGFYRVSDVGFSSFLITKEEYDEVLVLLSGMV